MVKLGFAREMLLCKLSSNYVRDRQEIKQIEWRKHRFDFFSVGQNGQLTNKISWESCYLFFL